MRVEAGLDRGLSLGRNALDYLLTDLDYKAQQVARELNGAPALSATLKLPALRNQLGVRMNRRVRPPRPADRPLRASQAGAPNRRKRPRVKCWSALPMASRFASPKPWPGAAWCCAWPCPPYPLGFNNERLTVQLSQPAPRQIAEDAELVDATRSRIPPVGLVARGAQSAFTG